MEKYKNRDLIQGQKVKVYFNLHKKKFSVVALEGEHKERVVAHTEKLKLTNCYFSVGQAGRQRVLREQAKNVHAFVYGFYEGTEVQEGVKAFYNPYRLDTFFTENEIPLFEHPTVSLFNKTVHLN